MRNSQTQMYKTIFRPDIFLAYTLLSGSGGLLISRIENDQKLNILNENYFYDTIPTKICVLSTIESR